MFHDNYVLRNIRYAVNGLMMANINNIKDRKIQFPLYNIVTKPCLEISLITSILKYTFKYISRSNKNVNISEASE